MNTPDINTIAFQYLLRTESQHDNNDAEEQTIIEFNQDQYFEAQNSLLLQLYNLEEEDLYI